MTDIKTIAIMAALSASMTANAQTQENDSITYMLNLQEVVVKSHAPKTKMKDGANDNPDRGDTARIGRNG